jgi:hypothetical protein
VPPAIHRQKRIQGRYPAVELFFRGESDVDDCRPGRRNIARTDRDIAHLRAHRDDLTVTVRDSLAPPIRHQREQHELPRIDTILEGHDDRAGQGD